MGEQLPSPNAGHAEALRVLLRLVAAFVLALPVGWQRERGARTTGLRTYPLVALAACGFLSVARLVFAGDLAEQSNVVAALLSGVGVVAGGAVLRGRGEVQGLASAAALWVTAAIGAAAAFDLFGLGAAAALFTFGVLVAGARLQQAPAGEGRGR